MTYMRQVLQERSMFFSDLNDDFILYESKTKKNKKTKKKKYDKSKHIAFKQHPEAAKIKASVIEAENILNSKGEYNKSMRSRVWTCLLKLIRNLGDFIMFSGGMGGPIVVVGGPTSFIIQYAILLISIIISGCILRYLADKGEIKNERSNALKVLSELKKLESKASGSEKARIREQIEKIEKALED